MNIQQLRYVVAIADNGTFREAASKLFVSQPSLSVAVKELEKELEFDIFNRTSTGAVLTQRGLLFYERAVEIVKQFDRFEHQYAMTRDHEKKQFSIASQHYDFLAPLITRYGEQYPERQDLRVFESTTMQILDEVAKGYSELGLIYLNAQNREGLRQKMEKLGLVFEELRPFQTHIYLRKGHPLAEKASLSIEDLVGLPTVRFTQEKDAYLYYSENLVDRTTSPQIFNVSDRATLNGILERTDAYATGSGFLDEKSVTGIRVIPLENGITNQLVYVKRQDLPLTPCAQHFIEMMRSYFQE